MRYHREDNDSNKDEVPDLSGSYTAADYLSWQVEELRELIRRKIFKMSPTPAPGHQLILTELVYQMKLQFPLREGCTLCLSPFDGYLIHSRCRLAANAECC